MLPPRFDIKSLIPSDINNIFSNLKLLFKHLLFSIVLYKVSLLISTNIKIARLFTFITTIFIFYEFMSKKLMSSLSPFGIMKGLFIFVPVLLYTNYKYIFSVNSENIETKLFTTILAINIFLAPLMLCFNSNEKLSKLNGIYLTVLALLTPKIYYNDKTENIVFTNNKLWCISSTIILLETYLFNNFYYKINWRYPGLYSIIIPTIHSIVYNDIFLWFPLRLYSLIITFIIMLKFPFIQNQLSDKLNSKILWSTDKYDNVKSLFSIIELFITFKLIKQGHKNTFLNYFYY